MIYEGVFANDLPHGEGVLCKDGLVRFQGTFANGEPTKGVIFNTDGSKLFDGSISDWNDDSFIGEGQLYADNKVIYQGELIMQGGGIALGKQGSLYYDSGELFFKGDLYGDVPYGKGSFYNKDGSLIFEVSFNVTPGRSICNTIKLKNLNNKVHYIDPVCMIKGC